jgi:hypothetical protein
MGRFRAASLLLAALAVGVLLAACGSNSGAELLPGTTADQINSNLDLVRESVDAERCEEAEEAVTKVSTEVDELHKVDKKLKEALTQGAAKLSEVVSRCSAPEKEAEAEKSAEEEAEAEEEALAAEEAEAEEEAFEKDQKAEERELKEQEKAQKQAEKEAEQPEPPDEGEESGKGKESQEETVEPPVEEEVTPPSEGGGPGGAGGIGPGAAVEGGP